MRKLTILQSRLISEVIYDDQIFQAKIAGCEVEDYSVVEKHTDFSEGFKAMQQALNGF